MKEMCKKLLVLLIGTMLIISSTGCKQKTVVETIQEQPETEDTTTEQAEEVVVINPKQEILDADWDSGLFQIEDKLIQLPIKLSELVDLGFDYMINGEPDSENKLIGDKIYSIQVLYKGEIVFSQAGIQGEQGLNRITDLDPEITQLNFTEMIHDKLTIFAPKGIRVGSDFSEIEKKYGKCRVIQGLTYCYGTGMMVGNDLNYGLEIKVDDSTGTVSNFNANFDTIFSKKDRLGEMEYEIKTTTDEPYKMKFNYVEDSVLKREGTMYESLYTVLKRKGNLYQITLPLNSFQRKELVSELPGKKEEIYNQKNGAGIRCRVFYYTEDNYFQLYCTDGTVVYNPVIRIQNLTKEMNNEDILDTFENLVIDIGKSIEFTQE